MNSIPWADPHAAYAQRREAVLEAVTRVLDSGRYILGEEVERFESAFAAWVGASRCVAVGNGTDAVELCLRGLNMGPGSAVFTVSHTAVATVAAVERAGAVPVLVDIDRNTGTMCPVSLQRAVVAVRDRTELRPGAVVAVHMYGQPCDMDALLAVAAEYHLPVVEDCAQAHGARYKGKMTGTLAHAAAFSFYPTKNLGALGDAGAVVTSDQALADRLIALRQYGWRQHYISVEPGINSRMDPVQAAILRVQLGFLDEDVRRRRTIAARYNAVFAECGLDLFASPAWSEHAYHLYAALAPERETFRRFLADRGVNTAVHYPLPVHAQPAYTPQSGRVITAPDGLPVTEEVYRSIVSLPMFPQLTDEQVEQVCDAVRAWSDRKK